MSGCLTLIVVRVGAEPSMDYLLVGIVEIVNSGFNQGLVTASPGNAFRFPLLFQIFPGGSLSF